MLVIAAGALGVVIGAFLSILLLATGLDWSALLNKETLPAWVQAVGSIVAIFVAIGVPTSLWRRDKHRAEVDRRLKARAMAHLLWPELLELKADVSGRLKDLNALRITAPSFHPPDTKAEKLAKIRVRLTPELERNVDAMYLFGEALGTTLLQLVAILSQYSRLLARITETGKPIRPDLLRPLLMAAARLIDEAMESMASIHDVAISEP